MPIYEYFCSNCNSRFELLRSIGCLNEDAFCPTCHTRGEKVLSAFTASSRDSDGVSVPVGGSDRCAACSATNCSTCL